MRVILTRPERDARSWVDALTAKGVETLVLPLMALEDPPDPEAVRHTWLELARFDAILFVSGNAVEGFFKQKPAEATDWCAQAAIKLRAYVTGPASRAALLRQGVDAAAIDAPDPKSGQFDSEALWAVVEPQVSPGFRLLVVRGADAADTDSGGSGRDWFAAQVLAKGGQVQWLAAYRRACPAWDGAEQEQARHAAQDGSVWLFSSSQAIRNLRQLMPDRPWSMAKAVATHPRIAQAARDAGFGVVCVSRPVLAEVVASIESLQ